MTAHIDDDRSGEPALPPARRAAFWRGLQERMRGHDDLKCGRATSESWLFHNGSLNCGSLFSVARWRSSEMHAQFAFEGRSAATAFAILLVRRAEIDARFEVAPAWRNPES